ncbi:MAG: hypothetical protein C4575_07375 [Desulforudis sp.]|nr:MAG: hypothetical protein C4575_07375 [Desulforudis sp.]
MAQEYLKSVKKSLNIRDFIKYLYKDKLKHVKAYAYRESGRLDIPAFLHKKTITELFPIPDKNNCEKLVGINIDNLIYLLDAGIVQVSIQDPELYKDIQYLQPILKSRDRRPPSYEIRDRIFYTFLSKGGYDDYLKEAAKHPAISQRKWPITLLEPYERLGNITPERLVLKNIKRYAALCSVMGPDFMREVVRCKSNDDKTIIETMRRFFYLHKIIIHPITQGLFGHPYNFLMDFHANERKTIREYSNKIEEVLIDNLKLSIPNNIDVMQIMKSHEKKVPEQYEYVQQSILAKVIDIKNTRLVKDDVNIEDIVNSLCEKSKSFTNKSVRLTHIGLKVSTILAGGFLALINPELGISLQASAEIIPKSLAEHTAHLLTDLFGVDPLLFHYWKLASKVKRITHSA